MRFAKQIAVVTGGARGIGFGIAKRLAEEGAAVALLDRNREGANAAAQKIQGEAGAFATDVSSPEDVKRTMSDVLKRFGRIDVLVNAAGIYPASPFESLPFEEWRSVMSVNLDGTFLCCQAVFPAMRAQGYGRIVNIASATFRKGNANFAAYVASKGGVVGLTRVIASEGGPHGITANVIAPGVIDSEGMHATPMSEAVLTGIIALQPVKVGGQPSDIAAAVAYLASAEARFITGQTVGVNGGSVYD